ncbi:Uncharacterized conserved protein HemY, contains two TPR repeats [Roseivivax lentus]|uniref:Uncharacterized conserved protein HemY, contains two TPR repeats n=1 Tax=Roseivivax lentus TaxID=633194 RepID=A0A1N7Q2D3_9RHOB|nr:tetratricopeptide repeat protein [Roseivivax lentus]SIT17008.1 Uncharacterized conserved protein HemY, contains two TPR repeats [Roseivivax lentus]
MFKHLAHIFAVLLLLGALSACDSSEDRAEKHFRKSVELYEAGDTARAAVELRNVFKLNGAHLDARKLMARIEEDRGNPAAAFNQYLAVTEHHPEDIQAVRGAARLAAMLGNWTAASHHAKVAGELLAVGQTDQVLREINLALAYRRAREDQDPQEMQRISRQMADLLTDDPTLILARRAQIDERLYRQDWTSALQAIDAGLEHNPDERVYYGLRLVVLKKLGRSDAIEAQLRDMVDRFPDEDSLRRTLLRWYVSQNRTDDAEAYLRDRIQPDVRNPDARLMLVDFLIQFRGPDAALAEIDKILADTAPADPDRPLYQAAQAMLAFEAGDHETTITEMRAIVDGAQSSEHLPAIKIALAKMIEQSGDLVASRALVQEVLDADATNVEALKMRAEWMIQADRPEEALVDLRRALDQAPRNADLFTLMAHAHERLGNNSVMGEMLSRALEASNSAPEESMRYAAFLMGEDRLLPAEDVLIGALRLRPDHIQMLVMLGDLYVQLEDWRRAQGVVDRLAQLQEADAAVNALTIRVLVGQRRQDDLRAMLERLSRNTSGDKRAVGLAARARLDEGNLHGALDLIADGLAEFPDDPELRLISAGLSALSGETNEARKTLLKLVEESPKNERPWIALYYLHQSEGEPEQAEEVLDRARKALPESSVLNLALAGHLEKMGNFEAAIAVYEDLYNRNSDSAVLANNLASLLSSFREDKASLERAHVIARRLRGTNVPQFQDTYGWITARLGNHREALDYLEPAAKALPDDPVVNYHLARTLAMAGNNKSALETYRKTLRLIETSGRPLPFRDEINTEIVRLSSDLAVQE